jgi:two-component system, response regulator, stage 0 sporulation protein F
MKPRIVAIDDETGFIDILQSYFTPRGYEIDTATRAAVGIEIVKQKRPDVVLMDLKMPGIDGDEALRLLKSMDPSPKVILITAYDDGGKTKARLLKAGAYACLDKPITSLKSLEDTINTAANG